MSLFRSAERRLRCVRFARLALRTVNWLLFIYVIYTTAWFALYGFIPRTHLYYASSVLLVCIIVNGVMSFFAPAHSHKYIRVIDQHYTCDDSLNAAYDIIRKKRDWHEWNSMVLQRASKHISNKRIRLSYCIPYHIRTSFIVFIVLTGVITGLFVFENTSSGTEWRISKIKKHLTREAAILTDASRDIADQDTPQYKNESLELQKIAHDLRMLAKTDNPSDFQHTAVALLDHITAIQQEFTKRQGISPDFIESLNKTQQTVQSLTSQAGHTLKNNKLKDTASGSSTKTGEGIGTQKRDRGDEREKRLPSPQDVSSEQLMIEKNGQQGTQASASTVTDTIDNSVSASVEKIDNRTTGQAQPSTQLTGKTERLKPIAVGTNFLQSPVWFENIPASRRGHILRYFSKTSDIREQQE